MRTRTRRCLAVMLALAALAPAAVDTATATTDPEIAAGFSDLRARIDGSPTIARGHRTALLATLNNAEGRGATCEAAHQLDVLAGKAMDFRRGARGSTAAPDLEDVHNRTTILRSDLLRTLPATAPCVPASGIDDPPTVTVGPNDTSIVPASVGFGAPSFTTVVEAGETFTEVHIPGLDSVTGPPGLPAVPEWRTLVAVPEGADVAVDVHDAPVAQTLAINLVPHRGEARDQEAADPFGDPPLTKDAATYSSPAPYPPSTCRASKVGTMRDLTLAQLSCAAGRYVPSTQTLDLFSSLSFDVRFIGGIGSFVTTAALSPFEPSLASVAGLALNGASVGSYVRADVISRTCRGSELLVLSAPDLLPAARRLARWKNDKGIDTDVQVVADGAGFGPDTADQIDAFIADQYDRCTVRPSYVLLLGDAELVPTYTLIGVQAIIDDDEADVTSGTDYLYALHPNGDLNNPGLPTFAVGRIPVDTLEQADDVVDKVIRYEATPPGLDSFYTSATIASYFQCCRSNMRNGTDMRGFIETSEAVRSNLVGSGYSVDRIYTTDTAYNSSYTADATPRRYYNGSLLPSPLRAANGFTWTGNRPQVLNAIDEGRFLVIHRDHGSEDGWVSPSVRTSHIDDLDNGELLPVVFSINCASGYFDNEINQEYGTTADGVYFAEQLLREADGGAVGIIGDTRNSPTWANNVMLTGLTDAVFPSLVSTFGGSAPKRRLGDILNHAKAYLVNQIGVSGNLPGPDGDTAVVNQYLYHVFGDPTLEMWTERPLLLTADFSAAFLPQAIRVAYAEEGATITALQPSPLGVTAIGRATVIGGIAELSYVHQPEEALPVVFSASKANTVPRLLTPPAPSVDVDIVDAELFEGTQYGSFAAVNVRLSEPSEQQVTVRVTSSDGSAVAPGDYHAVDQVVTIEAGQTETTVYVFVVPDGTIEATETFTLHLSDPTGATIGDGEATVAIFDDDGPKFNPPQG